MVLVIVLFGANRRHFGALGAPSGSPQGSGPRLHCLASGFFEQSAPATECNMQPAGTGRDQFEDSIGLPPLTGVAPDEKRSFVETQRGGQPIGRWSAEVSFGSGAGAGAHQHRSDQTTPLLA